MNITIKENVTVDLYGFSGVAIGKNWGATGMKLMNRLWPEVRSHSLKHKGINIWVYEADDKMFAGVELEAPAGPGTELEFKETCLPYLEIYGHWTEDESKLETELLWCLE